MKKKKTGFVIFLLIFCLTFLCMACKKPKETQTAPNTTSSNSVGTTEQPLAEDLTGTLTLEQVYNHPVSPESDFRCGQDNDSNLVLEKYIGNDEIVVVPATIDGRPIVATYDEPFVGSTVRAIRFPDTITRFETKTCSLNEELEILVFGAGTKQICDMAFFGCSALHTVVLNEGLEEIGMEAFDGSEALREITIPATVTSLGLHIFFGGNPDLVIRGEKGSEAERYAEEYRFSFEENCVNNH